MSVRSLTQAEAEKRATLVAVERYDIAVDFTALPAGPEVRCVSTVTFTCREPGAATFVDCAAEVVAATLNGVPLGAAAEGRLPLTGLAERNTLVVETVQADTAEGEGVHKAVDPVDGTVYAWTSFEPDEARFVWACFDQPDLKAPHAFTVTAPAGWIVVSNTGDPVIEEVAGGRRWAFPATPPLSTYNTVINAGPLVEIRRTAGGHDLGLFTRRSLAHVLERDADEIFRLTGQGLAFFAEAFGMPFPQRKYDQVFMPEYGGAMENFGCVTWSDAALHRSPPSPAEREYLAKVLLHELAHMWFGNIVTMRWWDDLWLNEAFAEFAACWAAASATAYTGTWAGHLAGGKLRAYLADQGPTSHPIHQPIADVAQAASIFDAITYPKGASALRQLMTYVGERNFRAGMAAYFARHAWGNTSLDDLMAALAEASGRSLDGWRHAWLETAGTDRLSLADGALVVSGLPRPHVLSIGAYRSTGDSLDRVALVDVEVTAARTPVELPAADLYLVNDEDRTFATTRLADGVPLTIAGQLPTPLSRGVAVATAWDMLLNAEATAADVVHCLAAVLTAEDSDSVIEPYLTLACDAAELWSAAPSSLAAVVASACGALAKDPNRRQVALRTLARTAADLDAVAALLDQAGDEVDLRWRALVRKATLGGDTAGDVEALLARDPDPDAWVRALAVRAATPDPAEKAAAWDRLIVDRAVPIGSVALVTSAFWRPGQDELLAPYAGRYLDALPDLHRGGMTPAMVYSSRLFPLFAIDEEYLGRVKRAQENAAPVVQRTVLERADLLGRMLRSRSLS